MTIETAPPATSVADRSGSRTGRDPARRVGPERRVRTAPAATAAGRRRSRVRVRRGTVVGIVGESGSGKTMTANAIMRLLPRGGKIVSGQITFAGMSLLDLPEEEIRRLRGKRMAMIFQNPMTSLNPSLTIGRQMSDMLVHHERISHDEATARALTCCEKSAPPRSSGSSRLSPPALGGHAATRHHRHGPLLPARSAHRRRADDRARRDDSGADPGTAGPDRRRPATAPSSSSPTISASSPASATRWWSCCAERSSRRGRWSEC